jgi:hypothetical protein
MNLRPSDLVRLACVVRKLECEHFGLRYTKPHRVEFRNMGYGLHAGTEVLRFRDRHNKLLWEVAIAKLNGIMGKEQYMIDDRTAEPYPRKPTPQEEVQDIDHKWRWMPCQPIRDHFYQLCLV